MKKKLFASEQNHLPKAAYPFRKGFFPIGTMLILRIGNYSWSMKQYQLGEFEEVVLLTVAVLYNEAYGVAIKKEIEGRLSRSVSVGALQSALQRMEEKGYLKSSDGEATSDRAGRPRKYFLITALGRKALQFTRDTREELWRAIPKIAFQNKLTSC